MCPNWCSTTLAIHGPTEDVHKFIEDNKGAEVGPEFGLADGEVRELPLSFERAIPTPDQSKFEGMDYKQTLNEPDYWYNFHVENWGTKWDLGDSTGFDVEDNLSDGTSLASYAFDTAWAPPTTWLENVAAKYPTLSMKMEYHEPGMGFAGVLGFHKGREVENEYWEQGFHTDVDQYDEMYGEDVGLTS